MGSTRSLLLVEDDPLVRMTLAEALTEAGFEVLEAEDAETALGLVAARDDLVVADDRHQPARGGWLRPGARRAAAAAGPARRLCLRPLLARPDRHRALPGAAFLAKPFSVSCAVQALEGAISGA